MKKTLLRVCGVTLPFILVGFFAVAIFITLPFHAFASGGAFITTWNTANPGTSTSSQITIPTHGAGYNYAVDWGDGNTSSNVAGNITHTYTSPGIYTVSITGTFPGIYFNGGGDRQKILTVEQWGTIGWTFMQHAFEGATNLTSNASDVPNLSSVTDMSYMFKNAPLWNANMSAWNTSTITLMNWLFYNDTAFNQNISSWDVSHVTDMSYMFGGDTAMAFNQPIGTWTTTALTLTNWMFFNDRSFNQSLNSWDVSHVTDMSYMFKNATVFNGAISSWNTSSLLIMNDMFYGATAFNQPIGSWDVSHVGNMTDVFYFAQAFNQNINSWNVSNVAFMTDMFLAAISFNQPLNSWNVSNVQAMDGMFENSIFNQNISAWHTSSLINMNAMFTGSQFNQNINSWDVSHVTDMTYLFAFDPVFNQPLNSWNTSSVAQMGGMFYADGPSVFNQNISSWNTSHVTNMSVMFDAATHFNQDISSWDVSHVASMNGMFINSGLSTANYDALLSSWSQESLHASVTLGANTLTYCTAASARTNIINTYNWTITDAGLSCRTLSYTASAGGSISGTTTQSVGVGGSGTTVTAIPATGGLFIGWSDGATQAARTDTNITGNISVTAIFKSNHSVASLPVYPLPPLGETEGFDIKNNTANTVTLSLRVDPNTIKGYMIGTDQDFAGITSITPYTGNEVTYILPNQASRTIYLKYYSTTGNWSPVFSVDIKNTVALSARGTVVRSSSAVTSQRMLFAQTLKKGVTGVSVKLLQQFLNSHGFPIASTGVGSVGQETNYFGSSTVTALSEFQKANNILPASGFFGQTTLKFVNTMITAGK